MNKENLLQRYAGRESFITDLIVTPATHYLPVFFKDKPAAGLDFTGTYLIKMRTAGEDTSEDTSLIIESTLQDLARAHPHLEIKERKKSATKIRFGNPKGNLGDYFDQRNIDFFCEEVYEREMVRMHERGLMLYDNGMNNNCQHGVGNILFYAILHEHNEKVPEGLFPIRRLELMQIDKGNIAYTKEFLYGAR